MFRIWLLISCFFLLTGCGSDDLSQPEGFQVTITVRDTQGDPVEGLELTMVPDSPLYMDGKAGDSDPVPLQFSLSASSPNPFFPVTTIRFAAAQACWAQLVIEDVARGVVRTLLDQEIPAGDHAVMWNSQDDGDETVPSGVYYAHLVMTGLEQNAVLFDESQTLLLAHWGEGSPTLATTDAAGSLVLTDRRLFPYLYDVAPFPASDENGNETGLIELSPAMRFYLNDPVAGHMMRFDEDVTGRSAFLFTWEY